MHNHVLSYCNTIQENVFLWQGQNFDLTLNFEPKCPNCLCCYTLTNSGTIFIYVNFSWRKAMLLKPTITSTTLLWAGLIFSAHTTLDTFRIRRILGLVLPVCMTYTNVQSKVGLRSSPETWCRLSKITSLTECNRDTVQKFPFRSGFCDWAQKYKNYIR